MQSTQPYAPMVKKRVKQPEFFVSKKRAALLDPLPDFKKKQIM